MNQRLRFVALWALRLAAWSILIALSWRIATNYRGITVRNQCKRLYFPAEANLAASWLIRQVQPESTEIVVPYRSATERATSLIDTLMPKSICGELTIKLSAYGRDGMLLAFDPDGRLLGSPVVWRDPLYATGTPIRQPQIISIGDLSFLVILKWMWIPVDNRKPVYLIHRLAFPESPLLLCLETGDANTYYSWPMPIHDGPPGIEILELSGASQSPDRADEQRVRFLWDQDSGAFLLPPPDPYNRWRAARDEAELSNSP